MRHPKAILAVRTTQKLDVKCVCLRRAAVKCTQRAMPWKRLIIQISLFEGGAAVICCLCFASFSVAILTMTHKMSSCMLFSQLVAIPLLCVFCLFWFGCGFVCFVCLVAFVLVCDLFLMGPLTGLCTGPLPVLLWLSTSRQPCMIIAIHLFAAIERV